MQIKKVRYNKQYFEEKMVNFNDIYSKVGIQIVQNGWYDASDIEKFDIFDKSLKKYLIFKILEINPYTLVDKIDYEDFSNLNIEQLINILNENILKKDHISTLSQIIHYVLAIIGELQGFEVLWYVEKDEQLVENPQLIYVDQTLESLKTNEDFNFEKSFLLVYEILQNMLTKSEKKTPK